MNCQCKLSSSEQTVGLPDKFRPRFLSGLEKDSLDALLSLATHRQFYGPSVILRQEDSAEQLFLLTSGRGRHFVQTSDGRKIPLHWVTAGQIIGGAAILSTPSLYLASTELLEDSCAFVWDRKTIREFALRFPILLDNTLSIAISEHIEGLVAAYAAINSDETGRIGHLLVSLACGIGKVGPDGVKIQVGREDLAVGANVTELTVSRTLDAWEREGVLTRSRGEILLRRPDLLITRGSPLS